MRAAYLVNNSESIISVPLFEKVQVVVKNKIKNRVQFKNLVPGERYFLGNNISSEKKRYYKQFQAVLVDLVYEIVQEKPVQPIKPALPPIEKVAEVPEVQEHSVEPENVEVEEQQRVVEKFDEATLMKKRQAELIEIATGMGLDVNTQNSKAEITRAILVK